MTEIAPPYKPRVTLTNRINFCLLKLTVLTKQFKVNINNHIRPSNLQNAVDINVHIKLVLRISRDLTSTCIVYSGNNSVYCVRSRNLYGDIETVIKIYFIIKIYSKGH